MLQTAGTYQYVFLVYDKHIFATSLIISLRIVCLQLENSRKVNEMEESEKYRQRTKTPFSARNLTFVEIN